MLKITQKELMVICPTLLFCYISHKFDCYNAMIIYLLVRIWVDNKIEN